MSGWKSAYLGERKEGLPGRIWPKCGADQPALEVRKGRKTRIHAARSLEEGNSVHGCSAFLGAAPAVRESGLLQGFPDLRRAQQPVRNSREVSNTFGAIGATRIHTWRRRCTTQRASVTGKRAHPITDASGRTRAYAKSTTRRAATAGRFQAKGIDATEPEAKRARPPDRSSSRSMAALCDFLGFVSSARLRGLGPTTSSSLCLMIAVPLLNDRRR